MYIYHTFTNVSLMLGFAHFVTPNTWILNAATLMGLLMALSQKIASGPAHTKHNSKIYMFIFCYRRNYQVPVNYNKIRQYDMFRSLVFIFLSNIQHNIFHWFQNTPTTNTFYCPQNMNNYKVQILTTFYNTTSSSRYMYTCTRMYTHVYSHKTLRMFI